MLEIVNKWMSKAEAQQALESGKGFSTLSGSVLYIVAREADTVSGKPQYRFSVDGEEFVGGLDKMTRLCKEVVKDGQIKKVTIPAKVDNSQAHGEHKVVSIKQSAKKDGVKAEQLVSQALELLQCSDSKKAAVLSAFNSALLQHERCMNEALQFAADKKKADAEAEKARKQAELAAKKKAEAEAKRQAEERDIMINFLITNKGMSRSDAEEFLG